MGNKITLETSLPLSQHAHNAIEAYLANLDGNKPSNLYQMVLAEIEVPLLKAILKYTKNNQSQTATILGLNRGTLRKKLKQYDL